MNAPTLLIGLGGTGSKIISKVSAMVSPEERNNISFAVFDTDINELRVIQETHPFIKTIQTSTRQAVGEYLNIDTHARDTWFPVNGILNGKALSEGAGQVRSISRLALETAIRSGKMEPLHEAVQELYKVEEDKQEQALRVVIVSSLAGGTGSGLILPVALYVRNYLKTHFRLSANITRGFFILPEVFYGVIKGPTERNNLKANAYAAIRELDAFLMKNDDTLHERYKDSVAIHFPKVASEGYEEYDVRPYDFCFLFDAQNAEGGKLNSFDQYLDHAANCIYAQSIGPMNKRSNSSEDNTIRKLAKEHGRNRYAGAGVSMLVYPFEDIKKLFALKWAKQSVSSLWLKYDNLYKEYVKDRASLREEGLSIGDNQTLAEYYVSQVESDNAADVPFARAIYVASGNYRNGVTRETDKWDMYVAELMNKIGEDISSTASSLDSRARDVRSRINELGQDKDWSTFITVYNDMQEYALLSEQYVTNVSQTIAHSLFRGSHTSGANNCEQPYKLEYYIAPEGKYMHPNAARYLLIKILERMKETKMSVEQGKVKSKKFFETFEKNTFDDTKTDAEETVDDLARRKKSLNTKADMTQMADDFSNYLTIVKKYQAQCAQDYVLMKGIEYIETLINSYEQFFMSFESKVEGMDKEIANIYKKYSDTKGTTVRYVSASKDCLDKMYEKKPYTGGVVSIDSKLAQTIYDQVLEYSLLREKPNANRYFNKLFDDGIIGYFEDSVMNSYGAELDIDAITALQNEADYIGGFDDADDADKLIIQYVKKVIEDTRKLACPFIERPLGETTDPINSCTFNKSLKPDKGDESPISQIIRSELLDYGGEADEDVPRKMIMFYSSFYGLRANDLSKFAPPEKTETYNRTGGEYFKAYFDLIQGIHPSSQKSKGISPHCDRWWHIITKMPDLDEENQAKQEYDIYSAFFWAFYYRFVSLKSENNKQIYKFSKLLLDMDDDTLIVSNGTDCDKFYEVLDAIAIYPELTAKILSKVNSDLADDIDEGVSLEESYFMTQLANFEIDEPLLGAKETKSHCIFDIPLLMKKSATPDIYYEEDVVNMLKVSIQEIKRYISNFCSPSDLPVAVKTVILDQFAKHLESLKIEAKSNKLVYTEPLFEKTCDVIYNALYEIDCKRDARKIYETMQNLKRQSAQD